MPLSRFRRAYDHRLRDLVCEERDPILFSDLGVPRSTAASWIRRGQRPVVSAEILALDIQDLQIEVLELQRRLRFLLAIIRLAFLLVRLSGFRLDSKRVPDGNVLAQVEVSFSNSMIEAWWRSLKHGWLYLHQLDNFAALERPIAFYVEQHNTVVPHAAFAGQTPDEMYFGRGEQIPANLATARARAREARLKTKRDVSCETCKATAVLPSDIPDSSAISTMLQMRAKNSQMS